MPTIRRTFNHFSLRFVANIKYGKHLLSECLVSLYLKKLWVLVHRLAKRWLFSILDFGFKSEKKIEKASRGHNEDNKFYISSENKCNSKNFSILHLIVLK